MIAALTMAAVTAFNLTCSIDQTLYRNNETPETSSYTLVVKVDLRLGIWCDGACRTTAPIFDVSPTQITLAQSWPDNEDPFDFYSLDRESGDLTREFGVKKVVAHSLKGHCRRGAFTGFPKRRF